MLIASGAGPESSDHVYLTDFGLTKHAASRSGLTAAGHFVGTIDYVAPEQIEGKSIDSRTDVYSLGCVLYEILTGRMPYERDTEVSVMYAHINDAPPTASTLRPELTTGIDGVIAKALAKKPEDRFATCRELVAAAREELGIVSGEKPQAVTPSGGTVIAASGAVAAGAAGAAAAAAASNIPKGETVSDAPTPAAAGSAPSAGNEWQSAPAAQQGGGGWQQGQPPQGPNEPGWQQGPPQQGPSDPGWQQGPPPGGSGGGGGWQGGPPPGGTPPGGTGGWQEGPPPSKGPNKGLLIGLIGAAVLIGGAVGAFLLVGGGDDPDPATSPSPAVSPATSPSISISPAFTISPSASPAVSPSVEAGFPAPGEEEFLYNHIPTPLRSTCTSQDPSLMPANATVGITCDTSGGADFVSYYKYPTLPIMNNQYELGISISGAVKNTGSCPQDIPSETTYTQRSNKVVGRLLCYEFEGAGRIEWTNNKLIVYTEAVNLNGMSPALQAFWANEAGPLSQPTS